MEKSATKEVMDILNKVNICLMSSYKEDGQIHTRPMAIAHKDDTTGPCLYFYIKNSSQVGKEISDEKDVYLSYMDDQSHLYLSLKGVGKIKEDEKLKKELWKEEFQNWFPHGVKDGELGLVEVELKEAYIWDKSGARDVKLGTSRERFTAQEGQQHPSPH